jgi:hypothetical protein
VTSEIENEIEIGARESGEHVGPCGKTFPAVDTLEQLEAKGEIHDHRIGGREHVLRLGAVAKPSSVRSHTLISI